MNTKVYVEILPDGRTYSAKAQGVRTSSVRVGKTWKKRPDTSAVTPGAIVAEVQIDVPQERMDFIVQTMVAPF